MHRFDEHGFHCGAWRTTLPKVASELIAAGDGVLVVSLGVHNNDQAVTRELQQATGIMFMGYCSRQLHRLVTDYW